MTEVTPIWHIEQALKSMRDLARAHRADAQRSLERAVEAEKMIPEYEAALERLKAA